MNENFQIFIAQLAFAHQQFCIWRYLQNDKNREMFEESATFLKVFMDTFLSGFLIELAKLTESKNSNFNNVVSIYSLTEETLSEKKEVIIKIKKLRNKLLSHNDSDTLQGIKDFMREINLENGDIEDLFDFLINWADDNKANFGDITDYKSSYFPDVKKLIEEETEKFVNMCKNGLNR